MAQKVSIQLVSDLTGEVIADGKGETVNFSLDGTTYEIDLTNKEADKFRGYFQDYIAQGRKVGSARGRRGGAARAGSSDAKQIRAWAAENGIEGPERGRIPADERAKYGAAH